jgi:hypothetical protein
MSRVACEAELRAMYDAATRRLIRAAATTASTSVKPDLELLITDFMALLSTAAGDSVGVTFFVILDSVFAFVGRAGQHRWEIFDLGSTIYSVHEVVDFSVVLNGV